MARLPALALLLGNSPTSNQDACKGLGLWNLKKDPYELVLLIGPLTITPSSIYPPTCSLRGLGPPMNLHAVVLGFQTRAIMKREGTPCQSSLGSMGFEGRWSLFVWGGFWIEL